MELPAPPSVLLVSTSSHRNSRKSIVLPPPFLGDSYWTKQTRLPNPVTHPSQPRMFILGSTFASLPLLQSPREVVGDLFGILQLQRDVERLTKRTESRPRLDTTCRGRFSKRILSYKYHVPKRHRLSLLTSGCRQCCWVTGDTRYDTNGARFVKQRIKKPKE